MKISTFARPDSASIAADPVSPLVAQIPVSVRTEEQYGTYGNRIMLMTAPLFTDEADAVTRLRRTHEAMGDMKERHKALPAELLQDANHFIPPAVFARAARTSLEFSATSRSRPSDSSTSSPRRRARTEASRSCCLRSSVGSTRWSGSGASSLR